MGHVQKSQAVRALRHECMTAGDDNTTVRCREAVARMEPRHCLGTVLYLSNVLYQVLVPGTGNVMYCTVLVLVLVMYCTTVLYWYW
jgi:hypothetical protein